MKLKKAYVVLSVDDLRALMRAALVRGRAELARRPGSKLGRQCICLDNLEVVDMGDRLQISSIDVLDSARKLLS